MCLKIFSYSRLSDITLIIMKYVLVEASIQKGRYEKYTCVVGKNASYFKSTWNKTKLVFHTICFLLSLEPL